MCTVYYRLLLEDSEGYGHELNRVHSLGDAKHFIHHNWHQENLYEMMVAFLDYFTYLCFQTLDGAKITVVKIHLRMMYLG